MKKIHLFLMMLVAAFGFTAASAQELSKFDYTPDENYPMITDIDQLYSPCSDASEGSLGALIGEPDNHPGDAFWHSDYHGVYEGQHYFQVELIGTPSTDVLAFVFTRRPTASNHIIKWGVYGTNDASVGKDGCTELRICDTPFSNNTETLYEVFEHQNFKYLRFYNEGTNTGSVFFHLSAFQIYPTIKNDADEVARLKLLDLYNLVKENLYTSGDIVGAIDASLVDEFYSALEEAVAKGDDDSATAAELNALYDRLKAAYDACEAALAQTEFKPGYYYLLNAKSAHHALEEGGLKFYMNMIEAKKAGWAKMDDEDPTYVWKFEEMGVDADGDAYYSMQNLGTDLYVNRYDQSSRNDLQEEPDMVYVLPCGGAQYCVWVQTSSGGWIPIHQEGHGGATSQTATGYIVGWNEGKDSPSAWYFIRVDDSVVAELEQAKDMLKVKEEFNTLLDEATVIYSRAFEYYVPDDAEDVTPTSADDFWSNAACSAEHGYSWQDDGAGYGALIDDDISTHFHTCYQGSPQGSVIAWTEYDEAGEPTSNAEPTTKHNLAMKLTRPVSEIGFEFYPRQSAYWDSPRDIDVLVSTDEGQTWTRVVKSWDRFNLYAPGSDFRSNTPNDAIAPAYTGPMQLGGEYQYIRIDVNHARRSIYFNLAELRAFVGMKAVESSQAASMDESTIQNMQNALTTAKEIEKPTQSDIANLQAALDNFKTVFADPTDLRQAVNNANSVLATAQKVEAGEDDIVGEGIGYYSGNVTSGDLQSVIEEAEALLAGTYTKAQLDAALAKVKAAVEVVEAALKADIQQTPDAGKWYQIRFPDYDKFAAHEDWNMGNGESENDQLWGRVATIAHDKFTPIYPDEAFNDIPMYSIDPWDFESGDEVMSYWRFIPMGDDYYAIQNQGTGLFMRINKTGRGNPNTISYVPTLFKVEGLGYGLCLLRSYDLVTKEAYTTLHFQLDDCLMVGWNSFALNTNSALELVEVGDVSGDAEIGSFYETLREGQAYTYCLPSAVSTQNEGGKMYSVAGRFEDDGTQYVALSEITQAAPGESFVLIADGDFNPSEELEVMTDLHLTGEIVDAPATSNGLTGTFVSTNVNDGDGILTANNNGNYWRIASGSNKGIEEMTAYIAAIESLSECDPTDVCIIIGDAPVGIKGAKTTFKANDVYTLTGVKVGTTADLKNLQRGIYVIKNRKVLVP